MLCELCKQSQATVHLTEIVNEQMTELHLCETCANQKGAQMEGQFGLADLLGGLADFDKTPELEEEGASSQDACPNCKMTFEDFRKVGRLGCSDCYTTFKRGVGSLLKRIHGTTHHLGKSPALLTKSSKARSELMDMRRKLERTIEAEEFEEAAKLRDAIRKLEQREPPQVPPKKS